jgi:hypothetical protein
MNVARFVGVGVGSDLPLRKVHLYSFDRKNLSSLMIAPYLAGIIELSLDFNLLVNHKFAETLSTLTSVLLLLPSLENLCFGIRSLNNHYSRESVNVIWNLPRVKILKLDLDSIPRLIAPLLENVICINIHKFDVPHVLLDTCNARRITMLVHQNNNNIVDTTLDEDILFTGSMTALLFGELVLKVTTFECNHLPSQFIPLLSKMNLLTQIRLRNMIFPSYDIIGRLLHNWMYIEEIEIITSVKVGILLSHESTMINNWLETLPSNSSSIVTLSHLRILHLFGLSQRFVNLVRCPKMTTLQVCNVRCDYPDEECVTITTFLNQCPRLEEISLLCPFQLTNSIQLNELVSLKKLHFYYKHMNMYTLLTLFSSYHNIVNLGMYEPDWSRMDIFNVVIGLLPIKIKNLHLGLNKLSVKWKQKR